MFVTAGSSFPAEVSIMFHAQATEIIRRCVSGFSEEASLAASGPQAKLDDINDKSQVEKARKAMGQVKPSESVGKHSMSASGIKNIKHDISVLKKMKDIKEASVAGAKPCQYEKHATAERKDARKALRRLAATESEADQLALELLKQAEEAEMKTLMRKQCTDSSTPCLLPVARFLMSEYIKRLPEEKCQKCLELVFPINPKAPALTQHKHDRRPIRVPCGHWLHFTCLDIWLTTPPFSRDCPICTRRIWHVDWPQDVMQLEKAWMKKEETEREKNDIGSMMGF